MSEKNKNATTTKIAMAISMGAIAFLHLFSAHDRYRIDLILVGLVVLVICFGAVLLLIKRLRGVSSEMKKSGKANVDRT